jgi:hypothetical protein
MTTPSTPQELRKGVREGILTALGRDTELRGARTARRLVSAGFVGVAGAIGAMALVLEHPYGHHPHWHEFIFTAIWTGLLIVSLALVFLQLRTPSLPIGRAAAVGLLTLGVAGVCSLLCPDRHVMQWWLESTPGTWLATRTIAPLSALCFGLGTTFGFASIGAALLLSRSPSHVSIRALAASMILLLLLPGLILESVGLGASVFAGWIAGTAIGGYAGVVAGIALRRGLHGLLSPGE